MNRTLADTFGEPADLAGLKSAVSGFTNVLGLATTPIPNDFTDMITEVNYCPAAR